MESSWLHCLANASCLSLGEAELGPSVAPSPGASSLRRFCRKNGKATPLKVAPLDTLLQSAALLAAPAAKISFIFRYTAFVQPNPITLVL